MDSVRWSEEAELSFSFSCQDGLVGCIDGLGFFHNRVVRHDELVFRDAFDVLVHELHMRSERTSPTDVLDGVVVGVNGTTGQAVGLEGLLVHVIAGII